MDGIGRVESGTEPESDAGCQNRGVNFCQTPLLIFSLKSLCASQCDVMRE